MRREGRSRKGQLSETDASMACMKRGKRKELALKSLRLWCRCQNVPYSPEGTPECQVEISRPKCPVVLSHWLELPKESLSRARMLQRHYIWRLSTDCTVYKKFSLEKSEQRIYMNAIRRKSFNLTALLQMGKTRFTNHIDQINQPGSLTGWFYCGKVGVCVQSRLPEKSQFR